MRAIRYGLLGLLALLVLALVAVVVVVATTDFNRYRPLIEAQVKSISGRDLSIAGDFALSLSLKPTVVVHDVKLANAPWGSRPDMAVIRTLEAELELLPLLSGQVKVDHVLLQGADILLETDKDGQGNWNLVPGDAAGAGGGAGAPPVIDRVSIADSTLALRDGQSGQQHRLDLKALAVASTSVTSPVSVEAAGAVDGAPLTLSGTLGSPWAMLGNQPVPLDLKLSLAGAALTLKGQVTDPAHARGIDVALTAEGRSLAELGTVAGLPLPPLGPYQVAGRLTDLEGSAFHLAGLRVRLGGSDLAGEATLTLGGPRPRLAADLAADRLDAQDIGIRPGNGGTRGGTLIPADPLPFGILTRLDGDIRFSGKQVLKAPVVLSDVALEARLEAGKLTIERFATGLAGGTVAASGAIDAARAEATLELHAETRRVEAGALLQMLDVSRVLSGGRVNLSLDVTGQGRSLHAVAASLDGQTRMDMGPGDIDNDFVRLLMADLVKLLSFGGSGSNSNLNCIAARFDLRGGVATTRGLVIDTPAVTVVGSGEIRLDTENLDLVLVPHAKSPGLASLAVPMQVRGPIANPSVFPDPIGTATGLAGSAVGVAAGVALAPVAIIGALAGLTGSSALASDAAGRNPCTDALAGAKPEPPRSTGEKILTAPVDAAKGIGDAIKGIFE
ncbi:MAG: AsmA family protein [Dongiaceae bacterium]